MKLIAICGLPGSGKDHFANQLIEGGGWSRIAFAGPLKRGLSAMFDIPMADIENPVIKNEPNYKFGKSIRYMAQTLGTEWARNLIAENVWLQIAKESIEHQMGHGQNVVITDLRFPNEVDMIKKMGGKIVKVIRSDNVHAGSSAVNGVLGHISDVAIADRDCDYIIQNDSTAASYNDKIEVVKHTI